VHTPVLSKPWADKLPKLPKWLPVRMQALLMNAQGVRMLCVQESAQESACL